PARNILTRAVGSQEEIEADLIEEDLQPGDLLLLCSDGLTNMVEDQEILETLRRDGVEPESGAQALIDLANERGGDDNITAVLAVASAGGGHDTIPAVIGQAAKGPSRS